MLSKPRYQRIWNTAILPIIDFISLYLGIFVVYVIRYNWFEDNFLGSRQLNLREYLFFSITATFAIIIVYAFLGLYDIFVRKNWWQTLFRLGFGILLVLLSLIVFFFFNEYNRETLPEGVPVSRFVLATGGFVALYFVVVGRLLIWSIKQIFYHFGFGQINIGIIGDKANILTKNFEKMLFIKKVFSYKDLSEDVFKSLEKEIKVGNISEIYLLEDKKRLGSNLANLAERWKVNFLFSPEGLTDYKSFGLNPIIIKNKLLLEVKHTNLDGWQFVIKRLFDIVVSAAFLILFSWLYLLVAILIKIDSRGPIFYASQRVGPNGKTFKLFKFRRLKAEFCVTEENQEAVNFEKELIKKYDIRKDSILYKIQNDPRSTKLGKFLEKTSLDELPQFINVLIGNMSLVGPRPHQPREVAKYKDKHFKVFNINPGITGFAQVNGRSDLVFDKEVDYDIFYLENWSFWLDLYILLKTPFVVIFSKHKG
jgi:exopolysaccharide biosynthesis polyprenyl glycosylphosphotransferase